MCGPHTKEVQHLYRIRDKRIKDTGIGEGRGERGRLTHDRVGEGTRTGDNKANMLQNIDRVS